MYVCMYVYESHACKASYVSSLLFYHVFRYPLFKNTKMFVNALWWRAQMQKFPKFQLYYRIQMAMKKC